jgi:hypothetical protein
MLRILRNNIGLIAQMLDLPGVVKMRTISRQWWYLARLIPFGVIAAKINNKHDKLLAMAAFYLHLPVQGTAEWLAARSGKSEDGLTEILLKLSGIARHLIPSPIGGSEIGAIRGEDGGPKKVVKSKLGVNKFFGSPATRWGKLFEPVLNQYTCEVFNTTLFETGSVPGLRDSNGFPIQSYSPDGVAVIARDRLVAVLARENSKNTETPEWQQTLLNGPEELIVLVEFKCPISRVLDGRVPKKYYSQPRLGMVGLDIPEIAVFGDAMFKKCGVADFDFGMNYDYLYHGATTLELRPVVMGFIGIYDDTVIKLPPPLKPAGMDILKKITRRLGQLVRSSMDRNNSDWSYLHAIELKPYHAPAILSIAYIHFSKLLINEFAEYEISSNDDQTIMINLLVQMIPAVKRDGLSADRRVEFLEYINVASIQSNRYDFSDLCYGNDYGQTTNDLINRECSQTGFNQLLESMFDPKPGQTSYKQYYSEFCYKPENPNANSFIGDGIDIDLSSTARCRKWLWQQIARFEDFCYYRGFRVVGIIPWKLLDVRFIPVYKEPDFLESCKPMLVEVAKAISQIRQQPTPDMQLELLEQLYPGKPLKTDNTFDNEPAIETGIEPVELDFESEPLIVDIAKK